MVFSQAELWFLARLLGNHINGGDDTAPSTTIYTKIREELAKQGISSHAAPPFKATISEYKWVVLDGNS